MAQEQDFVRNRQYSQAGRLQIRTVGTEEWYALPDYEATGPKSKANVVRPTFRPGTISFLQQVQKPAYEEQRLASDLYMSQATFNVAELYDIRVKESKYGISNVNDNQYQIRIEILAVSKAPPVSQGLVAKAGLHVGEVFNKAEDTSESIASSVAIANLSDRWVSGDQEIMLSFTRATQTERTTGAKKGRRGMESVTTKAKVWIWNAFLAFLCGMEWSAQNHDQLDNAARRSLAQIVDSNFPNPYAEFEKKDDDWILVKINAEEVAKRIKRAERFAAPVPSPSTAGSSAGVAGPSASRKTFPTRPPPVAVSSGVLASPWESNEPPIPGTDLSESVKDGKRKATEEVEEKRQGKRVEIANRSQLERELVEAQCEARVWRDEERRFREKAEKAEKRERWLQQQLESLKL